jgi:hypothetical protein
MGSEKHKHQLGFSSIGSRGKTTSTFDDEWDLRWNFNIENKLGVGWHQYSLPGIQPHLLLETSGKDAKLLYEWADEWQLPIQKQLK